MIRRLICFFRGHKWEFVWSPNHSSVYIYATAGIICERCDTGVVRYFTKKEMSEWVINLLQQEKTSAERALLASGFKIWMGVWSKPCDTCTGGLNRDTRDPHKWSICGVNGVCRGTGWLPIAIPTEKGEG